MFNYGLIGKKLGHSYSKDIHHKLGNLEYDLKELNENEFSIFMKEKSFKAINVTIPYKQDVIKYLDYIDDDAKAIGAVNTIVNDNGLLKGYNTDILGLNLVIDKINLSLNNKKVLILGTGGTSNTAKQLCLNHDVNKVYKVSRTIGDDRDTITYNEVATKCSDFDVIINTTPSGMYPNNYDKAISVKDFKNLEAVVDVIYNPLRTLLRLDANEHNIKAVNGLYMLVAQAVFADSLFFDKKCDARDIESIYKELLKNKLNICLIGMPFSGKSTIGKELANKLGKDFVDVDEYITTKMKSTPAEIITNKGEEYFRDIETDVVRELSMLSNSIISTGGGSVLRKENVDRLKMSSLMVYIKRDNPIITSDRPLATNKEMYDELLAKRKPIYEKSADIIIDNNDTIDKSVDIIIDKFNDNDIIF